MSTQTATLAAIRALGMTARCTDGEYRVAFRGRASEASAYYTDDAGDALSTARAMVAVHAPRMERLARFIRSHYAHAFVRGVTVLCGFHAMTGDRLPFTMLETVRTLEEARDALGY